MRNHRGKNRIFVSFKVAKLYVGKIIINEYEIEWFA